LGVNFINNYTVHLDRNYEFDLEGHIFGVNTFLGAGSISWIGRPGMCSRIALMDDNYYTLITIVPLTFNVCVGSLVTTDGNCRTSTAAASS
jgi:hypothetical protein